MKSHVSPSVRPQNVLGARIEAERTLGKVHKRERRSAALHAAGPATSTTWRTAEAPGCGGQRADLARPARYLSTRPAARCPEHGVRTEAVPWGGNGQRLRDFGGLGGVAGRWYRLGLRARPRRVAQRGGVAARLRRAGARARGLTACAASASTRRRTRRGQYVTKHVDHDRSCQHLGARSGTGKDRTQPVPRRASRASRGAP